MQKKIVPAIWFQNKLSPAPRQPAKPRVIELMEAELGRVAGGIADTYTCSNCVCDDSCD